MSDIAVKNLTRCGAFQGLPAGFIELLDEQDQTHVIKFHLGGIQQLICGISKANELISIELQKTGQITGPQIITKKITQYEFGYDQQAQVAVMTVRFADQTSQPIQFEKDDLKSVIQSLTNLLNMVEATPPAAQH